MSQLAKNVRLREQKKLVQHGIMAFERLLESHIIRHQVKFDEKLLGFTQNRSTTDANFLSQTSSREIRSPGLLLGAAAR